MLRLLTAILLILNVFMFYNLFWTESGIPQLMEIRKSFEELEGRNHDLIQQNKELSRTIIALRNDNHYLKQAIRREMRYVKDNEIIYHFPEEHEN